MAGPSRAVDIGEIAAGLPRRIHDVVAHRAAHAPGRVALIEEGAAWSYGELDRRATDIATALSSLGLRAGDRMIIVSENCIPLVALLLAASRLDAWAIVANPGLSARELDRIRDHSGARRMFFTSSVSKEAAAHASRLGAKNRQLGPLPGIGVGPLDEHATVEPVEIGASKQVAALIYTAGTTGTSKGVMLSHDNLLISAKAAAHFRNMDHDDKVYLVLPISHIVGLSLLIMTLMVGGTVRLASRSDPAMLAKALVDEGITMLDGASATYQGLLEYKNIAGLKQVARGALRLIAVSGSSLDLNLKRGVEREFGLPLLNGYGTTECSSGISAVRFDAPRFDDAVGALLPGVAARVRTLDGIPLSRGEVGELHVRGRSVMRGYYRAPDLTARVMDTERWFNTGDLARFEGDCLHIVGRSKEMIGAISAGIEAILNAHKHVHSSVVGQALTGNGELVAFVRPLPGSRIKPIDLMEAIKPRLTSYIRPPKIIVVDVLPGSSTGKIREHELAGCLRADRTAAKQAAKLHRRTHLT
ncbi:class I adenylate-forming enzyme family protein [Bradyrhizobium sp. CB3481]|uniref:class I adenylate-forming enzyme family protein n=1 Tax=Bradyrhizobium sp. CB3481 TaxID=3039158 RepID=UPI0024B1679E|nr:class I adenylate-forming enzyme family protein [Bradyrhizobium sp. CB3481]WFU18429.1 class I adenylate-forming enzyme family protein [Bradyrhizobium sp. CB3481]